MTFEELYQKVRDARSGGVYTLRGDALQSPELGLLLARVAGGELRVAMDADPVRDGERAIVEGPVRNPVLGLEGLTARAELFLANGRPQALISFPPADGTASLADLFPALKDQPAGPFAVLRPEMRLATVPGTDAGRMAQLAEWQAERPLTWDPETDGAALARHLELRGEVGLPAGWEWVHDLLPPDARPVHGTLELHPGGPRAWLTLAWPRALTLGHLTASFTLDVVTLLDAATYQGTRTVSPRTLFRLGAILAYDAVQIPSYAWFLSGSREVEFETITGPAVHKALDAFKDLLGGVVPTDFIPRDRFPPVDRVVLQRIRWALGMDTLRPRFLQADFGMEPGERMELIPGMLVVDALNVSVSVTGLDTGTPAPALYASGRFGVPGSPLHGDIEGYLSLPDLAFGVGLTQGSYIDVTDLLHRVLPVDLGLPEIHCTGLRMDGSVQDRRVSFYGELDAPEGRLLFIRLDSVWLGFDHAGGAVKEDSLRLGGHFTVGEDTEIELEAEFYREGETKGWRFSGSLDADPDHPLRLTDLLPEELRPDPELFAFDVQHVSVRIDTGHKRVEFELGTSDAHLDFGAAGNARLRGVTVAVEKTDKGYDWSVRTRGRIELAELEHEDGTRRPLVALDGELVQAGGKKEAGIWFQSASADSGLHDVWLPIPAGYREGTDALQWSSFDLGLQRIGLTRETGGGPLADAPPAGAPDGVEWAFPRDAGLDEADAPAALADGEGSFLPARVDWPVPPFAGTERGRWKFEVDTTLTFNRLPRFLAGFIPAKGVHVRLTIDGRGADITLKENVLDLQLPKVVLPDPYGGPGMDLGPSRLRVGDLSLRLRRRFGVEAEVRYYLPQHLNDVFGRTADGQPRLGRLFETYDPQNPDGSRSLGFKVRGGMGDDGPYVGITPSGIPLHLLDDEDGWWVLNLGPREADGMGRYGCIKVQKGDFDLQPAKGRFKITGKVEVAKDPALPLELLKEFLRHNHQPQMAQVLPDLVRVPVRQPPDFWDAEGNLVPAKVAAFLGIDLHAHPSIDEALNRVARSYNRLPEDFRAYLAPPSLKSLAWHFEVRVDGGMEVGLEVDPPVHLLMVGGPSPVFSGVTLRKFAFGEMFGGQVFKVRMDADFDTFDVVTLGAAALVPESWYPGFGDPRRFRRRVMLHDLLVLVFMQLEVPIPVPVFFNPVGLQMYVPGNGTLQLQAAFPEPELNLAGLGALAGDLVKFVREPSFELDTKKVAPLDLQLTLGPAFFRGGPQGREITLGRTEPLPLPSAYQLLARVLNAVKFFDVDATVKTVPVEYRFAHVDDAEVVACLRVSGTWLLCTPSEFTGGLYRQMGIDEARMRLLMDLLPRPFGDRDKGVISFIDGSATLAGASFSAAAAFVSVSGRQLGMAVRMTGRVAGLLDVDARAQLLIAPPEVPFRLVGEGRTHFGVLGLSIFDGESRAEATSEQFTLEGRFELLPSNSILYVGTPRPITGRLTREELYVDGRVEGRVLIFTAGGEVTVSDHEVGWQLDFPGGRSGFRLAQEGSAILVRGDVPLLWVQLTTESRLYPVERMIRQRLASSTVANLLTLELEFTVPFGSGMDGLGGQFWLRVLPSVNPNPIVTGRATLWSSALDIGGDFKLFPDWWPFNLTGTVNGWFGADGFRLEGSVRFGLAILPLTFGVVITPSEFTLSGEDPFYYSRGSVLILNGALVIWGQAWNRWGRWSFYINDSFPFLHWGDPPSRGVLAGAAAEPERSWTQRLVRLAIMAEWRRTHAQPGAERVLLPDEEALSQRFDWHGVPMDEQGVVRLHARQRDGAQGLLQEVARRAPNAAFDGLAGAAITLEVPLRGDAPARVHVMVPGAANGPGRYLTAVHHPLAEDTVPEQLAAALEAPAS